MLNRLAESYLLINFEFYKAISAWDIESESKLDHSLIHFRFSNVTHFRSFEIYAFGFLLDMKFIEHICSFRRSYGGRWPKPRMLNDWSEKNLSP